ncbi:MAG: sugar ABC transporter substrate-binding protein [Armatimonadetes bacterium]|nr:sugar ABC transporter substrate-binding protein [Candidatus Hippobium faecium]
MKRISFLLVICILMCLAVGCNKDTNPDGTKKVKKTYLNVAVWASNEERAVMEPLFKKFEEEHPDTQLFVDYIISNQYKNKILTSLAGGTGPDVFLVYCSLFSAFQEKNVLYPLEELIVKDETFSKEDYLDSALNQFSRDGNLYCIPRDMLPISFIAYNKDCFDEKGLPYPKDFMTYPELIDLAQKVGVKKGNQISTFGLYLVDPMTVIKSYGGELVDNVEHPTKSAMTDEKFVKGVQLYHDMIYKYRISPTKAEIDAIGQDAMSMLKSKNIAMFWSGSWTLYMCKQEKENLNFGYVAGPHQPGMEPRFYQGGAGYGINKNTKHVEESWRMLKFITGYDSQYAMAESDYLFPSRKDVIKTLYIDKPTDEYGSRVNMAKAAEYVLPYPKTYISDKIEAAGSRDFDNYFLDTQSLEKTIKNVDKKINAVFAEEREKQARRAARKAKREARKKKK